MRLYGLMMLSLAFAAISCQKEPSAPAPDVPGQEKTSRLLKAYLSVETKAAITDNFGSVSWNPSDSISIFDSDSGSGGNKFVTEKGGTTAVFAGQASEPAGGYYYGVYPYSSSTSFASNVVSASLPAVQQAVSGSFDPAAFLMVGRSASTDQMGFYDALGGIRFTVSESGYDKVIFRGNANEAVAGSVSISFGEDGIPLCHAASSETSTQISLEGEFNAGKFYYLSIIPQSFKKGFTLTFYKGGTEVSRSVCESFVRVQRYYFATVRDADIPSSISNILDGEPLDAKGTANCYIVREAGSYKLPLVRGNSRTSVGAVDHAGVVWETDNSANAVAKGTLINSSVRVKNGCLYFKTAEQFRPGNALVAAYDSNDRILWSWHIWMCDFDADQTAQRYQGASVDMMDRNVGALSSSYEGVASYGLFYQWGRKDPFMGAASIDGTPMASTCQFEQLASNADCTVDFAVANPTTFITCDLSTGNDWLYAGRQNELWTDVKTIYDPCPAGWRVPKGGPDGVWNQVSEGSYSADTSNHGVRFTLSSGGVAWYPCTGYLKRGNATIALAGLFADYWTTTTASQTTTTFEIHVKNTAAESEINLYCNNKSRGDGHAVRCQRQ